MLQSELSLCISELYGGDDWNECFWLSAVINHEGWKSSSLLNCNAVNPDFAIGFCLHTASTDELSHMKQSQHNPNTNTSLNNSKFLRRFLFFFYYQIFLLLGRSLGSTEQGWRILICFFFHFSPPISGSLDQTAISYQLTLYCLTSKLKRVFSEELLQIFMEQHYWNTSRKKKTSVN